MKKFLFIIIVIFACICSALADTSDKGFLCKTNIYGDVILYRFKDGSFTNTVIIPDYITIIGNDCFCNCNSIKTVYIPDSVTYIGTGAFYGCYNLVNVRMSKNIENMGGLVFSYCSSLNYIYMPNKKLVNRYKNYKWKCSNLVLGNHIKAWSKAIVSSDGSLTILYQGRLEGSSNFRTWNVIRANGYYNGKLNTYKGFRCKSLSSKNIKYLKNKALKNRKSLNFYYYY